MVYLAAVWEGQSQWVRFYMSWPFGRAEITDHLVLEGLKPMHLRPEEVEAIEIQGGLRICKVFEIKHHRADLPKYLAFSVWNSSKVKEELLRCGFKVLKRSKIRK